MYQKERIDSIMNILKENGYVTVKYLINALHYSNATINRDLNVMENLNLITRSYGGAELIESTYIPVEFRYNKMKSLKRKFAKCAADLIQNGDTIYIDASTTCESIGVFITEKKDITVITNNMSLAIELSEYGINVICTGGQIVEVPYMLGGDDAVKTLMKYKTDKMFFSTCSFTETGIIQTGILYNLIYEVAINNTEKVYYLADHTKLNLPARYTLTDFSAVSAVITDCPFSDEVKRKYQSTRFYEVD